MQEDRVYRKGKILSYFEHPRYKEHYEAIEAKKAAATAAAEESNEYNNGDAERQQEVDHSPVALANSV